MLSLSFFFSSFFSRPSKLLIAETKPSNLKQTDASYTTIAETAE